MKSILIYFDDEEFEKLKQQKRELGLSWHDFVIVGADLIIESHEVMNADLTKTS